MLHTQDLTTDPNMAFRTANTNIEMKTDRSAFFSKAQLPLSTYDKTENFIPKLAVISYCKIAHSLNNKLGH